ncbi:MAG: hypothetical protein L0219_19930 [Phycisphaerales bacterium]|nr:hypothetical protein [Phycisphaerales bacterium]MCI0675216.1 hypothetical protein [Phycisphaerales bacterium]
MDQIQILKQPRFVVSINGERRCVAGFDGCAVLGATFSHMRNLDGMGEQGRSILEGAVRFRVGGMQGGEHVDWLVDELVVADQATVRVIEGGPNWRAC